MKKVLSVIAVLGLLMACEGLEKPQEEKTEKQGEEGENGKTEEQEQGQEIALTAIALNKTELTLDKGASETLTVTFTPENATNKALTWTSSNPEVATVADGLVSAVEAGTAEIVVTCGTLTDKCMVTVTLPVPDGAVDLGLSVYWASCNLGAESPEGFGDYYGWGDIEPNKEDYTWDNVQYYIKGEWTKYVPETPYESIYGPVDNKVILEPEDDPAHLVLGGDWHVPSLAEWAELQETCSWEWTAENEIEGFKVVGPNGNSIFIPGAGYRRGTTLNEGPFEYWTSSVSVTYPNNAWYVYGKSSTNAGRYCGRSIRPVLTKEADPQIVVLNALALNETSLSLIAGETETLTARFWPEDATDKTLTWTSSDPEVATVADGEVLAVNPGSAEIVAKCGFLQASCRLTVYPPAPDGAVNLGLSVYWASCNLGAARPEEYGDYYAWGEVEPYYTCLDPLTWKEETSGYDGYPEASYRWASYKWAHGAGEKLTKYCPESLNDYWDGAGSPDGKTVLDPEDDAAAVKLGGKWRMPTADEWRELIRGCKWEWIDPIGYQATSKTTGQSIILPVGGYFRMSTVYSAEYGWYWTSSLETESRPGYSAQDVDLRETFQPSLTYDSRCIGAVIRPVITD